MKDERGIDMKIIKKLSRLQQLLLLFLAVALIFSLLYFLLKEKNTTLSLKDEKDIVVEYGKQIELEFDDLISTKDFSKDEIKTIKNKTVIQADINNETGKDYPAPGKYQVKITYEKQELSKTVIVQDTVKPEFNEVNEVSITVNTQNYDYGSIIKATDLSNVTVNFDTSKINVAKAGDYEMTATAKDASGNETVKNITVHVKNNSYGVDGNVTGITYPGKGKTICIDAGHQAKGNSAKEPNGPGSSTMKAKVTSGATGCVTGTAESKINLQVAQKLQQILSERGYQVIMCRVSQDVDISNAQRAMIANNANAAAFVRLHCDSSESSSPTGTMTMAPSTNNRYCSQIASSSQKLAKAILNHTCQSAGSKSRGVTITDTMTGLNWASVPVTIIEMGFLSNPQEDRLLNDEAYQEKLAIGIANGIDEFLGN